MEYVCWAVAVRLAGISKRICRLQPPPDATGDEGDMDVDKNIKHSGVKELPPAGSGVQIQ